jgi:hypothetical protein
MTARRITAAILIALGLAAGAGATIATGGSDAPVASAPQTWYHQ